MEYDFNKDKLYRDSLQNDIFLLNHSKNDTLGTELNQSKEMKMNRVLFELKNSSNPDEKNFIKMNKLMPLKKTQKKSKIQDRVELQIPESKITKNIKSVLEMVFLKFNY